MQFLVVLAIAVACASADVSHVLSADYSAPIVRSNYESSPDGAFQFFYETGNKILAEADGVLKNANSDNPALEVKGHYSYIAPDGTPVETSYIANENGFQATGSHIPVGPETPELIARSLAYIAAHPPTPERVAANLLG